MFSSILNCYFRFYYINILLFIIWMRPLWDEITWWELFLLFQFEFRKTDGSSLIHIVEETLRSFYLAYIVKRGSAIHPSFSFHVQRLFEGGFLTFWYEYIEYSIITQHRRTQLIKKNAQNSLTLIDLQIAFFILFIGFSFAFLLFCIEIFIYKFKQRKHI